jgi:cell division septum initiation protein DivIVA
MEKFILVEDAVLRDTFWNAAVDLKKENDELKQRIKRLEEAGDALCENSNPSRWDSPADAAQKLTEQSNWTKAKGNP